MSNIPKFQIDDYVEIHDTHMHAIGKLVDCNKTRRTSVIKILYKISGWPGWNLDITYLVSDSNIIRKIDSRSIDILFKDNV